MFKKGEIMTKPNPLISCFESPFAISLYYLLFWNYQHSSQENLATTQKLFRNTSPHTFALWTPHSRELPLQTSLKRCKEFFCFVLCCFGKVMMAIDGVPSQTTAPHIIQTPFHSKPKETQKMGVSYTMSEVLERMKKKTEKKNIREFLEACSIDSFLTLHQILPLGVEMVLGFRVFQGLTKYVEVKASNACMHALWVPMKISNGFRV